MAVMIQSLAEKARAWLEGPSIAPEGRSPPESSRAEKRRADDGGQLWNSNRRPATEQRQPDNGAATPVRAEGEQAGATDGAHGDQPREAAHQEAESSRGIKRKAERSEIAYNDDLPLGLVRHHKSQRRQTDAGLPTLRGFAPLESLRFGMPPPAAALMAPGLQHRRRLCVKQLRRRALPVSAAAASAVLGDALELEDMSEAELQALRGPPGGAALALPASAAAGALALTTASASVKPPKTPAGPLAAGGDAGLEATIGSRTKAARTAPRTHSGPGGERVGGDDSAVVQLNFGTNAEGQKGATAGSERKQGAAPGGSGPWPGGARAVEPGLAGLANGGAGDHPGGGVPTQGAGQALPDAALAFRFGAAAAARPAPAPATQALAQQPAPPQFALGLGSGVAQALAAAPMAGAAGGRAQGGGSPAGLTMGAPAQGLFGAGAPAPGLPAVAAPQAAGFGMPGAGPLAPAVGAFTFGGAPATAQAPQPSAFGGQAGGFGAGASAAFGQPPLQAAPGLAHAGSMGPAGFTMGGGDQQKAARRVVKAKRPGRK